MNSIRRRLTAGEVNPLVSSVTVNALVTADTVNGHVSGSIVNSLVTADTVNGHVSGSTVNSLVTAATINGHVSGLKVNDLVTADTVNGHVSSERVNELVVFPDMFEPDKRTTVFSGSLSGVSIDGMETGFYKIHNSSGKTIDFYLDESLHAANDISTLSEQGGMHIEVAYRILKCRLLTDTTDVYLNITKIELLG